MKTKYIFLIVSSIIFNLTPLQACENCGCKKKSNNTTEHIHNFNTTTNDIYAQKSEVVWKAAKVGGEHEGNIAIRSGHLHFEDKKLVSGKVDIDMQSIACTDLEGSYKNQLEQHLNSSDFFDTKKYPISSIELIECTYKGYGKYEIDSKITIKGITQDVFFIASVKNGSAIANLKIDRAKFDIRYGSGSFFSDLGDKLIYDEFELNIRMTY